MTCLLAQLRGLNRTICSRCLAQDVAIQLDGYGHGGRAGSTKLEGSTGELSPSTWVLSEPLGNATR